MPIAKRVILSRAISVEGVIGQQYQRDGNYVSQRINDPAQERDFLDTVIRAYNQLRNLPTGRRLLDEIDASGKTCAIFCGSLRGQNLHGGAAIMQDVGDKRGSLDRYALPLSDYGTMLIRDDIVAGPNYQQEINNRIQGVRNYYQNTFTNRDRSFRQDNRVFQAVFGRVAQQHPLNPEAFIAGRCGIPESEVSEYLFGEKRINTSTNFKLSLGLYEFLIPGTGANTAVRLTAEIGINCRDNKPNLWQRAKGLSRYHVSTNEVRADIMLGHELIHAWRMMTGRRIIATGWEEEMMTVGLGPAARLEFTENRLRSEAGHPRRTSYPGLPASTQAGRELRAAFI